MGQRTARRSGLVGGCVGAVGALIALARPEKACPPNYVNLLPLRFVAIALTAGLAFAGILIFVVAKSDGSHRVAATLGVIVAIAATLMTVATIALAAGGFQNCWTF